ncbi:MAG: helix-turn-helix domain-containing protein [Lachnospiraceae bacterium]|nr:helix-turn-helix domain-containing protein [Lachnospiraceae bacterium]
MGRRSTKPNKNIYQLSREGQGLTREAAGEAMVYISDDRIEKIESGKSLPHPEEIITMSECYKNAALCNYYCANECPIGEKYVPELELKDLQSITLEVLNSLNRLQKKKDRLIEIAVDGVVHEDEQDDFRDIMKELQSMSASASTLRLWLEQAAWDDEGEN